MFAEPEALKAALNTPAWIMEQALGSRPSLGAYMIAMGTSRILTNSHRARSCHELCGMRTLYAPITSGSGKPLSRQAAR